MQEEGEDALHCRTWLLPCFKYFTFSPYVHQTFISKFNQLLCVGGAVCRQPVGGHRQFPLGGCVGDDAHVSGRRADGAVGGDYFRRRYRGGYNVYYV